MSAFVRVRKKLTSFQIILLGFAGVILLGAVLLALPISTRSGIAPAFESALFTSTSAVCVTGLVMHDTALYWSSFGQTVILILIQIGGLGVITLASFLSMVAGRKISLKERETLQNALSAPHVGGMVRLTKSIFIITAAAEGIGALLLLPVFLPKFGAKGIWMAVFHSISAFCNAGFDLMGAETGPFSSFTSMAGNLYFTIVIVLLIIVGGIGFVTWKDVLVKKTRFKEYALQTKIVLITTAVLILLPAVLFFFVDFADAPLKERFCLSVFQSVTPRTAGFNTANTALMSGPGKAVIMLLMLIGGSPGSTAGGMKTTTIALLFVNFAAVFRRKKEVNCFGRRVHDSIIKNASAILLLYVSLALTTAIVISLAEHLPMQICLFETVSAIGTVGLSFGITPLLSPLSHVLLILLMFFGRVGGLTFLYAAFLHRDRTELKYPAENIMVG